MEEAEEAPKDRERRAAKTSWTQMDIAGRAIRQGHVGSAKDNLPGSSSEHSRTLTIWSASLAM